MAQVIHRIIREETRCEDPYREIKRLSTEEALKVVEPARARILSSDRPFQTAARFAIAGNILDFALISLWDKERFLTTLDRVESQPIASSALELLEEKVDSSQTILLLGDNAGETVFDRLFIEQFPQEKEIYYAVKGSPIINDAVLRDARHAGLDSVATLVSNGTDAPGTLLDQCSREFLQLFENADLVIAKGQANFESLNDCFRPIIFMTQIKCPVIAERYQYETGQWVIVPYRPGSP
jgi:hypothetical protein